VRVFEPRDDDLASIKVGNGNDTLYVGTNDTLTVGTGHDSFIFQQTTPAPSARSQ
jgi:Ca2+-binding RTX toxin-like protein